MSKFLILFYLIIIENVKAVLHQFKGNYIPFGSFARKTKIRPLDDIDILLLLNGRGINVEISYQQKPSGYGVNMTAVCRVKITDARSPLQAFADDKGYVNSIKILNRIKHHHRRQ